ncbi:MAG: structural protein [Bacteroidota bacterium]
MATRGIRNNNPGNLRITNIGWKGKVPVSQNTDGAFEQFTSMVFGLRALMKDIINDYNFDGRRTIAQLIHEFAPPHENNTQAYIDSVASHTGINPNFQFDLNADSLRKLTRAIINHENGVIPASQITDSQINEAMGLLGPAWLLEEIVITAKKPTVWVPLLILGAAIVGIAATQKKKKSKNSK